MLPYALVLSVINCFGAKNVFALKGKLSMYFCSSSNNACGPKIFAI